MEDKEKAAVDFGIVVGMVIAASLCHFMFPSSERNKQEAEPKKSAQEQLVSTNACEQKAEAEKVMDEMEKKRQTELFAAEKKRKEEKIRAVRRQIYEAQRKKEEESRAADIQCQREWWEFEKERLGETPYTLIGKHERSFSTSTLGYLQFDTDGDTNTTEQILLLGLGECLAEETRFCDAKVGETKTKKEWDKNFRKICDHFHSIRWME